MSFSFSNFHDSVSANACGLTLDWQKIDDGTELCQWLWGRPINQELETKNIEEILEYGSSVSEAAKKENLIPVEPESFGMNLPNEVAVLESCPFRPDSCAGKHLVVSGTGKIS